MNGKDGGRIGLAYFPMFFSRFMRGRHHCTWNPCVFSLCIAFILFYHFFLRYAKSDFEDVQVVKLKNDGPAPSADDVFISSVYYFPKSQSMGENVVAVVMIAHNQVLSTQNPVLLTAMNSTGAKTTKFAIIQRVSPHNICPWITVFSIVKMLPNMEKLSLFQGNTFLQIPFEKASYKKRPVVTCISPVFAMEQWQNFVFSAHSHKLFGSFLYIYARSVVRPLYDLMIEYEKEGYLQIKPWIRQQMPVVPEYEFRNKAAAQTDCLLKFKEAATFISFMEMEDIIVPHFGNTLLDEFEFLFNIENYMVQKKIDRSSLILPAGSEKLPKIISKNPWWRARHKLKEIGYIAYSRRHLRTSEDDDGENFSLRRMLSSVSLSEKAEFGSFVTRPKHLNHTLVWQHQVWHKFLRYDIPKDTNKIMNLGGFGVEEENISNSLLTDRKIEEMEKDIKRMRSKSKISWKNLPKKFFFAEASKNCFNHSYFDYEYEKFVFEKFEGTKEEENKYFEGTQCPSLQKCQLPDKPDVPCANARADFVSSSALRMNVHYAKNIRFDFENNCIS